ncbi:transposase [Calothrix sp. NIES-4101]|nr:transposase [Calothrix sp. NIES-4101]
MYRKQGQNPISPENFELSFEGKLSSDNRWVVLASLIPWGEFEEEYSSRFSMEIGAPAKSFRMALGALIIKEKLGISDRETVEQIKENPYLQYFIGMSSYSNEAPFDASMLVNFRERISAELVNKVNQETVKKILETTSSQKTEKKTEEPEESEEPEKKANSPKNRGKLILDATCAPGDISYPTDIGLLTSCKVADRKNYRLSL